MKKLISTAFISLLMVLLAGYAISQDMMEKHEKSEMKDEVKPCPMHEKMMQEKGEMKDMGDKPMMEGKMMCPMCKMMSEGKMCPMHEKMMQQMKEGMKDQMMGGMGMMDMKMCPMHEKMMQQMKGKMMGGQMMCPMCKMMGGQGMMGGMGMMEVMKPDMMPGLHEMIFQLDLSKEQHEQINNFFNHHREEMERLQSERQHAEIEMNDVSREDMPDLRHVRELVQRIANLEADMKYSQFRVMVDAKSVLKEGQRANLRRKMEGKSPDKPMPKEKEKPDMPGHEGHEM